jgi:non-ribosomal peptide synthetase component F
MTLLSAFALLLERYSGQEDIVVGSPIANRQETQLEQLIGFFVNSLVMRVQVLPELSFRELLRAVRATTLDAYLHQDISFERLVEELSPQRNLNSPPLFQVVFALQNAPARPQLLKGVEIKPVIGDELRVRFDLELHALEREGQLELFWLYNRDLFDRWRIEQMARHYLNLLEAAVAAPEVPLARLEMLGAQERQFLVQDFNPTAHTVAERTVPALFEAQVARAPGALAVIFGQESLSYGELNARANRLAHHLIGLGVGPESLVGIALERSTEMIVALLGTLKAGAAYLPLDPDYPQARLVHMLIDGAPALVLSSSTLRTRLPVTVDVVSLDTAKALIEKAAPHNPTDAERTQALNA